MALARLGWELNVLALLFFALLLAAAAVMIYSLWIVLITLAFESQMSSHQSRFLHRYAAGDR